MLRSSLYTFVQLVIRVTVNAAGKSSSEKAVKVQKIDDHFRTHVIDFSTRRQYCAIIKVLGK